MTIRRNIRIHKTSLPSWPRSETSRPLFDQHLIPLNLTTRSPSCGTII
jgi:hypothetical protein